MCAKNTKSVSFGKNAILLRCEVEIRITEGLEIASPMWRKARVFDHVFQTLSLVFWHQAQLSLTIRLEGGAYGLERLSLLRDPVKGVERDDEIKLLLEW